MVSGRVAEPRPAFDPEHPDRPAASARLDILRHHLWRDDGLERFDLGQRQRAAEGRDRFALLPRDRRADSVPAVGGRSQRQDFRFQPDAPEGVQALVNGVRVEPVYDYTVDTVGSSITFLRALPVGVLVIFDLLTSAAQLAPSGSVNTVLVSPITPDGVKTTFTGLTVASNGHAVNVAKNEELLVSVDGVQQQPGTAYNASAAQITFAEAPRADALIFIIWFGPSVTTQAAPATSVWSSADAAAASGGMALSNGGLTVTPTTTAWSSLRGTISRSSGKLYVEFKNGASAATGAMLIGAGSSSMDIHDYLGDSQYSFGFYFLGPNAVVGMGAGGQAFYGSPNIPAANDVWALAIDLNAGNIWIAQNNIWLGASANPSVGANPQIVYIPANAPAPLFPAMSFNGANVSAWTIQPNAASQAYAPPTGFSAWDGP